MNEPVVFGVGGLAVALSRAADRYRHEVLLTAGGENQVLLTSLEGTADQPWPPSPPLQELHVERLGAGIEAALLVGRAGRSHWSASIEFDRSQETVTFDVACRCFGSIESLGSSYECLVDVAAVTGDDRTLLFPPPERLQVLEGELRISKRGKTALLTIVPSWVASPSSQTVRWKYRLERR